MPLINQLPAIKHRSTKRVGRGFGSGKGGHTAGRGQKGQKSRRGAKIALWFEGGQLPLIKRLPMWRGKRRLNKTNITYEVRLDELDRLDSDRITLDTLKLNKIVPERAKKAKVIASGKLTHKVTLVGIATTKKALEQIMAQGGSVE